MLRAFSLALACFAGISVALPCLIWVSINNWQLGETSVTGTTLAECVSLCGYSMVSLIPTFMGIAILGGVELQAPEGGLGGELPAGLSWPDRWLEKIPVLLFKPLTWMLHTLASLGTLLPWPSITLLFLAGCYSGRFLSRNLWPVLRASPLVEAQKLKSVMILWVVNHVILTMIVCGVFLG